MSIPHKTLDFLPDQCSQIHTRRKTRTLRLGDRSTYYLPGELILLTAFGLQIATVIIISVKVKRADSFIKKDLKGTEFKSLREACDKLRSIYRLPQILPNVVFSIIDWEYKEES